MFVKRMTSCATAHHVAKCAFELSILPRIQKRIYGGAADSKGQDQFVPSGGDQVRIAGSLDTSSEQEWQPAKCKAAHDKKYHLIRTMFNKKSKFRYKQTTITQNQISEF